MSLTRDLARLHSDSDGNLILAKNLTVDTNTLIVDAANNKVGINTTTPTTPLHVEGANGDILTVKSSSGSEFAMHVDGNEVSLKADADNDENDTVMTFDLDGSEKMRIDTSGTVLVGKTTSDGALTGHELRPASFAVHTVPGGPALYARRKTNDGDIAVFQDNSGTIGKIGVNGGSMYVGGGDVGTAYYQVADAIVPVDAGTGALRNNAIDLGMTSARYKDVHVGNAVKTSSAQFNAGGTYTADVFTNRNDNYFEGYRSCLGFFAPGGGNNYIHLKTNLPDNGNKMIKFEWNGFTYSGVNSHNSVTFYTYSGTNSPYNPIHHNWGNGHGIVNYYYSSDNYVVIVCQASGSYTGGFLYVQSGRSHIWYNPDITTASNSNATGGVY